MHNGLLRNVQSICGKTPQIFRIPKQDKYRFGVKVYEIERFKRLLSKNDLEHLKRRATYSVEVNRKDVRTIIVPLENPVVIKGNTIYALRLKGVLPQVREEGAVASYKSGNGFVKFKMEGFGRDSIRIVENEDQAEFQAYGTLRYSKLKVEVEAALALGNRTTEELLGFGLFEGLEFEGVPVGFAIYGMERRRDVRVGGEFVRQIGKRGGALPEAGDLVAHTGELLRRMHEEGMAHGFPRLDNYRKQNDGLAKLLDLDSTQNILRIPKDKRLPFIYLDLSRMINDYQRDIWYEEVYDREVEADYAQLTPLLPFFFWGYFRGDVSLPFVREMKQFVEDPVSVWRVNETFGQLPNFGGRWRRGGTFTLMEPIIQLYSGGGGGELSLSEYRSERLFDQFYAAIDQVAGNLC
jgi:hypothetical protein